MAAASWGGRAGQVHGVRRAALSAPAATMVSAIGPTHAGAPPTTADDSNPRPASPATLRSRSSAPPG